MRTIKPITRRESFLAAAGGQKVTVPTPITRSEIYLAALSDENITPPTVITREEQFLTAAIDYIRNHSGGGSAFTLSYYDDSGANLLYQEAVLSGGDGQGYSGDTPTKASTEQYDYSFVGWSSETGATEPTTDVLNNITADKSVYAAFEAVEKTFEVKFYNADVLLYTDENVEYGNTAVYSGDTPTKAETSQYTYTFIGWNSNSSASTADDNALTNVTADRNVYAIYTAAEKTFDVNFYNGDTLLETAQNVEYNGTATYTGSTPTKASTAQYDYTFAGWTKTQGSTTVDADALTGVTADRNVYAVFTATTRSYAVTFMNVSTLMDTQTVTYGGTAVYSGTTPTKAETSEYTYTFAGWNTNSSASTADADALTNVTADRTVYAIFTAVSKGYTVYFYNGETLLETVTGVPSGGTATFTGTEPTKEDYQFTGWLPSPTNITADTACYAQFEPLIDGLITDDWATISSRSAAGTAANYYSVGDCKAVDLKGTMGTIALDTTLYVYILGFDHNTANGESRGITFGGLKTDVKGTDVALCDSHYNSNSTDGSKWFNMSHWGNYNYGGWKGSDIRYDILGSTDVQPSGYGSDPTTSKVGYDATSTCATNPVSNTLMSCLPSDLRAVMKPMTKYTDNTGNSSTTSSTVTTSTDYLPLLAEFEVFGTRSYANETEKNKQAQYAYFVAGNSKIKYKQSNLSSPCYWWLRSPNYNRTCTFCGVGTNGGTNRYDAYISLGVAPAFLI